MVEGRAKTNPSTEEFKTAILYELLVCLDQEGVGSAQSQLSDYANSRKPNTMTLDNSFADEVKYLIEDKPVVGMFFT